MLQSENQRLMKELAQKPAPPNFGGAPAGGANNTQEFQETTKRLKKRELECQALWDTLKDMKVTGQEMFSTAQMLQILQKRALDTKANRKLGLQG